MGYHVLITNCMLRGRSGTTLYVRDLALALQQLGHRPEVLTMTLGAVSDELRAAGMRVVTRVRDLEARPDVIHGHHHLPTLAALSYFPDVPALYICHDHTSAFDRTPLHPRILRYFGVSQVCVERLIREGVAPERAELITNFVDMERFRPRPALPERPRRALVFSNYAHSSTYLPIVEEACRRCGLELDVVGSGVGNAVAQPEHMLGGYDIVFAKAKAAMEAMAVGSAVVICDTSGVGPLVTAAAFDALRPLNFGYQTMRAPLQVDVLVAQIARYDAADAAAVHALMRTHGGLDAAVERLVAVYAELVAAERRQAPGGSDNARVLSMRGQRAFLGLIDIWLWLPPARRAALRQLPILGPLLRTLKARIFPWA